MEQARMFLAIALSFLIFFLWQWFFTDEQAVQKDQQPPQTVKEEPVAKEAPFVKKTVPQAAQAPETDAGELSKTTQPARTLKVSSRFYEVEISEKGAGFSSFVLKDYRESVGKDSAFKELIPSSQAVGIPRIGLAENSLVGMQEAVFKADSDADKIRVDGAPQKIVFSWTSPEGVIVEKTYTFKPDTYLIGLTIALKNTSAARIHDNVTLTLTQPVPEKPNTYGFEGPSALIDQKLNQIKIKSIEEQGSYSGEVRWIALEGRYFMTSIIPVETVKAGVLLSLTADKKVENQYVQPLADIDPGTQKAFEYQLFFGPKSLKVLGDVDYDLKKAVNFGWFDFLAKPCLWLMNLLYSVIPNYGVAIIILTIMIKIVFWPLGSKSYKSMNEMKKLQPLMAEIREKYKNDKKKMNEETMGLYRTYKINPMGGCLPMVVQIPVFFALYRMLYQAIELRHAPFVGWINDLSAPDRLFHFDFSIPFMQPPYGIPVLTIIMGASMFFQQKMSPPPGDPSQAKIMMLMPIFFTFIFINFSSGLVLYWLVNNVLSIAQQYYIQQRSA
jgi:YidC/Oxa1 family membrane protein insertase